MDVALLDCTFPEAPRCVLSIKGSTTGTVAYPCMRRKTLAFSNRSPDCLPSFVLLLQRYSPHQADRTPPSTVRSNVFLLICCESVVGRSVDRGYPERFGGDGVIVGPHGGVWHLEDFFGSCAGDATAGVLW
jgi:hypothetical protein